MYQNLAVATCNWQLFQLTFDRFGNISFIRKLAPKIKIEVEVMESDCSKGYILLKSNANELHGE